MRACSHLRNLKAFGRDNQNNDPGSSWKATTRQCQWLGADGPPVDKSSTAERRQAWTGGRGRGAWTGRMLKKGKTAHLQRASSTQLPSQPRLPPPPPPVTDARFHIWLHYYPAAFRLSTAHPSCLSSQSMLAVLPTPAGHERARLRLRALSLSPL